MGAFRRLSLCYSRRVHTLAIESSSPHGSVALVRDGELLGESSHQRPNAHAESLLALVDELLARSQVQKHQLSRIVVGIGPGSFTGLRVGIALAQGMAFGLKIPAIGVPSLASVGLALREAQPDGADLYGVLQDARRGELFFAAYDPSGTEVQSPCLVSSASAAQHIADFVGQSRRILVGGDASELLPQPLRGSAPRAAWPHASCAAALADSPLASESLAPLYLRSADAKLPQLPPNPLDS